MSLASHLRKKVYICPRFGVSKREKPVLPRRLWSGPLLSFCKEQDFLHYVLNDGDNMWGIEGSCTHHMAPFPGFWFLSPDHTFCKTSRWKTGTWLRLRADCVTTGSQRLMYTYMAQRPFLHTGRFSWHRETLLLSKWRRKEMTCGCAGRGLLYFPL